MYIITFNNNKYCQEIEKIIIIVISRSVVPSANYGTTYVVCVPLWPGYCVTDGTDCIETIST